MLASAPTSRALLSSLALLGALVGATACHDDLPGLAPTLAPEPLSNGIADPGCADVTCPDGYECQLTDLSGNGGHLEPWCHEIEVPKCQDMYCGPAAECQMLDLGGDAPEPQCVPLACDEQPPAEGACDATCATGYLVAGDITTCSCCSPQDEPEPEYCLTDAECGTNELCIMGDVCETICEPNKPCTEECFGRCTANDLVVREHRNLPE